MMSEMPVRPNWELSTTEQLAANIVFFGAALAVLIYAIVVARRESKRYPLFLYLGAGFCVFYEVIIDHLGGVTYGEQNLVAIYTLWGRTIPLYILGVYLSYFGVAAVWLMHRLDAGITRRQWWRYYFWHVLACFAFEIIPIHYHLWAYWGDNQPFALFGFPNWWWFANGAMLFNSVAIMYLVRKYIITDSQTWLLVPIYPMAIFAVHGSSAIPVGLALNSTTNQAIIETASVATIGLALMQVWIFGHAVAKGCGPKREEHSDASVLAPIRSLTTP